MFRGPELCRDSEHEVIQPLKRSWDDWIDNTRIGTPLIGARSDSNARIAHLHEVAGDIVAHDVVAVGTEIGRCWIARRAVGGSACRKGIVYQLIDRISGLGQGR